jgi:Tfp pilus assembly protein PilE
MIFYVNQRKRVQGLQAVAELTIAVAIVAVLRTIGR